MHNTHKKHILETYQPQSGRSMVEMLGVLAVIGVLSVTAIGGYRYGMDKYQANEILKGISARAMTASMEKTQTHTLTLAGHADNINGYTVGKETAPGGDNTRFAITVSGVPEAICDLVLRDGPENALYVYGGDGTVTSCSDGDNTLAFIFNDNLSTTFKANDYNGNEDGCTGAGYTLCADDTCRADCCAGVDTTCQTCAANGTVTPKSGSCATASIENGVCSNGTCVADQCQGADYDAQCQSCNSVTGEITDLSGTCDYNNGSGNGVCANGECVQNLCYNVNCGSQGTCNSATGHCDCQNNYYGPACETAPLNCLNNGQWDTVNHVCDCTGTGYTGDTCETAENQGRNIIVNSYKKNGSAEAYYSLDTGSNWTKITGTGELGTSTQIKFKIERTARSIGYSDYICVEDGGNNINCGMSSSWLFHPMLGRNSSAESENLIFDQSDWGTNISFNIYLDSDD